MKEPKKGKKSFTEDLESVFHQTLFEDNLQDNPSMLLREQKSDKKTGKKGHTAAVESKEEETGSKTTKTSRKSFSDNMDLLFKESIEDVFEGSTVTEIKRNIINDKGRKAIGIDVLLQRTAVSDSELEENSLEPSTKRVTFVIDIEKIEQLKEIARQEKRRLRAIMSELVEQYIREHQSPPPPPEKPRGKGKR